MRVKLLATASMKYISQKTELTLLGLLTANADVTVLEVDSPHRVHGRPAASPVSISTIPTQQPTPLHTSFSQFFSSSVDKSSGTFTV